jgi:hypothetical protein
MELSELMDTASAARYLGVSRQRVYTLRANGRLAGISKAGRWFYLAKAVRKLAAELKEAKEMQQELVQANIERIEARLNRQGGLEL